MTLIEQQARLTKRLDAIQKEAVVLWGQLRNESACSTAQAMIELGSDVGSDGGESKAARVRAKLDALLNAATEYTAASHELRQVQQALRGMH